MRNVALAYRSLHPERTLGAVRDAEAAAKASVDAMKAYTSELLGEGWVMTASYQFDGSIHPVAFKRSEGRIKPADADRAPGLRFDSKRRELAPAKRTDEGKVIAARLDALAHRQPLIDGLGGIVHGRDGERGYFTGWSFHVFGGQVFATLSVPIIDEKRQEDALSTFWDLVRLSAFHAAREANEGVTTNG